MNRVARYFRTVTGVVLLCALASTVTAGASDRADGSDGSAAGDAPPGILPFPDSPVAIDESPPTSSVPGRQQPRETEDVAGTAQSNEKDQPTGAGRSKANGQPSEKGQADGDGRPSEKGEADGDGQPTEKGQGDGTGQANGKDASGGKAQAPKPQPDAKQRAAWQAFDDELRIRLAANDAVSVAVSIDGKIVHTAAFGERVAGQPADVNDRFRIASISKVIASTAALRLVDRGELALDKPVTGRVAEALGVAPSDPRAAQITVRQLLGHTSGFAGHDGEFFGGGADSCPAAAETAFRRSLSSNPGTSSNYSNMNFCMLGLVLEAVTGKSYDQVLRDEVLTPLGIDTMRIAGTFDVGLRDVRHHSSPGRNYMETLGAAGSWLGTPSDIVTLLDALDPATSTWHPVSNQLLAQMKAPSVNTAPDGPAPASLRQPRSQWYGLGLMVFGDGSYGHTGTLERSHAMAVARPDGLTWAVTVSGDTPSNSFDLRSIVDASLAAAGLS